MKILFLTNKRSTYATNVITYSNSLSSGLSNSVNFVVDMLNTTDNEARYTQVNDSNEIDREVTLYKPDIVIIEALWVPPYKLDELSKIHDVKWIVRIHSEIPFLANEGVAIDWLRSYSIIDNVYISSNSKRAKDEIEFIVDNEVLYLPNFYPVNLKHSRSSWHGILEHFVHHNGNPEIINIGCFGAIRPLKNQLIQATAALKFVDDIDRTLHFHINVNREEMGGNSVLKNLRNLFKDRKHLLVEHPWATHEDFIELIKNMNIGMQVSLSETYNIVTADMVNNYIPVVVSNEISWVSHECHVNPTSFKEIVQKLHHIYNHLSNKSLVNKNIELLKENSDQSTKQWLEVLNIF